MVGISGLIFLSLDTIFRPSAKASSSIRHADEVDMIELGEEEMSEKMLMDGRNDERNGDDQEVREEVLKTKYFSKLGDMAQSKKLHIYTLGGSQIKVLRRRSHGLVSRTARRIFEEGNA